MKKILAVDIGNTNITAGLFRGKKITGKLKVPTNGYSAYKNAFKKLLSNGTNDVMISSVVPLALCRVVATLNRVASCRINISGKDFKVPIANRYRIKSQVGQDRLVNAYAAKKLYGKPAIVIDFGTGITFDIISKKGDYLGGLILPGIEMGLSSLYTKTALLPKVALKPARELIGRDTASSMRGGILFGYGAMCDGLVAKYRKILGARTRVIATGGNASLIRRYSKSIQVVDPDLTLKGLRLLFA